MAPWMGRKRRKGIAVHSILLIVGGCLAATFGPRLLVDAVATAIGVLLVTRTERIRRELMQPRGPGGGDPAHDAGARRRGRRLLRAHLRLALRQTELASLLPATMARARAIAARRA